MKNHFDTKELVNYIIDGHGDNLDSIRSIIEYYNIDINALVLFDGYKDVNLTLLQYAVMYCRSSIAKYLINSGAKTDVADPEGNNLLHILANLDCKITNKSIVNRDYHSELLTRLLILHKVDTSALNRRGFTPFNLAIYTSNTTVIKVLLDYNIDLSQKTLIHDKNLNSFELLVSVYSGIKSGLARLVTLLTEHPNFDVNTLSGNPHLEMLKYCGKGCDLVYNDLLKKINKTNGGTEEPQQPQCTIF